MKLYLLNLGHCDADKGMVLTPGSGVGERIVIPIVGYLIETDDGQHILIDTGMHRKHIADPEATFRGKPFGQFITPIMTPEEDIANRLAEIGLTVDDIDILVSTHFHFDHAGNHGDFGNCADRGAAGVLRLREGQSGGVSAGHLGPAAPQV